MKRTLLNNRTPRYFVFTDPRMLNMEEYEGMGFDENNYSPIPPVSRASSKSAATKPTSTPKPEDEEHPK